MSLIMFLNIVVFFPAGCTKEDLSNNSIQAASSKKDVLALTETWINGSLAEKYDYANDRLVRVRSGRMDLVSMYTDKGHYTTMTRDYI